jgi:hypothetical protein
MQWAVLPFKTEDTRIALPLVANTLQFPDFAIYAKPQTRDIQPSPGYTPPSPVGEELHIPAPPFQQLAPSEPSDLATLTNLTVAL